MIKRFWDRLSPRLKKYITLAGVLGGVAAVVYLFQPTSPERKPRFANRDQANQAVFTDRDPRNLGVAGLAAQIEDLQKKLKETGDHVDKVEGAVTKASKDTPPAADAGEIKALRDKVEQLQKQVDAAPKPQKGKPGDKASGDKDDKADDEQPPSAADKKDGFPIVDGGKPDGVLAGRGRPAGRENLKSLFDQPAQPQGVVPPPAAGDKNQGQPLVANPTHQAPAGPAPQIRTIAEEAPPAAKSDAQKEREKGFYLPAGSILSGTLITGLDAPTGQAARKEPFPALARVKTEAILPNRFRADIRECFLILSGYGDLSSERAYMRGETVSCVRSDGNILEAALPAYAVGEDGKAGVRGRLVSKQGAIIAKALLAGFLEAATGAFNVKSVPVLSLTASKTAQYQSQLSPEAFQSAAVQGAGGALEKIAQFYIDQAGDMFPIIEVDAARKIDLILSSGVRVQFKDVGQMTGQTPRASSGASTGTSQQTPNIVQQIGQQAMQQGVANMQNRAATVQGAVGALGGLASRTNQTGMSGQ